MCGVNQVSKGHTSLVLSLSPPQHRPAYDMQRLVIAFPWLLSDS
jgi:hypothetical protein